MSNWVPNTENFGNFTYTGSSSIDITETIADIDKRIIEISFTLGSAGVQNEDLSISVESNSVSPSIIVPWYVKDTKGITSIVFTPEAPMLAQIDDNILITWNNVNSLTYTLTINYVDRFTVWRMDDLWR